MSAKPKLQNTEPFRAATIAGRAPGRKRDGGQAFENAAATHILDDHADRRPRARYRDLIEAAEFPYSGAMNAPARFEWNEDKADANFAKHGLRFSTAINVFLDPDWVAIETSRPEDGEERMKAIGLIDGRLFTVVFIMRGTVCRIISARRSNSAEKRKYGHGSIHA